MAQYTELFNATVDITNRPDLVRETELYIRKALLKFHGADSWNRDLAVHTLDLRLLEQSPENSARWVIPLNSFVGHRRHKDLRFEPHAYYSYRPTAGSDLFNYPWNRSIPCEVGFRRLDADDLFDSYKLEHPYYYQIIGNDLHIKCPWLVGNVQYVYYKQPAFSTVNDIDSWIANDYGMFVAEEAAAGVFKSIGKDDESALYRATFGENLQILKGADLG